MIGSLLKKAATLLSPQPTLAELYVQHQGKASDKWQLYLTEYERLLAPYRERPVCLLEIGIQNGGSLDIWAKYFRRARALVGCDINKRCAQLKYSDARIDVIIGDATCRDIQSELLKHGRFDIVIDDSSHKSGDIVKAFSAYFPAISDGGLFIAEDLHCSYWQNFDGGIFHPLSSMTFFKLLADVVNYEHWGLPEKRSWLLSDFIERYNLHLDESLLEQVHSVEFFNSVCVLRKRAPLVPALGKRIVAGTEASVDAAVLTVHNSTCPQRSQRDNPFAQQASIKKI